MALSDQPTGSSTGKIVGIIVGVIVVFGVCVVLAACATIVMLTLLGPAVGNVFSEIILEI